MYTQKLEIENGFKSKKEWEMRNQKVWNKKWRIELKMRNRREKKIWNEENVNRVFKH